MTESAPHIPPCDPERWLEEHGDFLYRFALLHLRDPSTAEDAVQETLLAAFTAKEKFSGQSAERTWLIGILKHKVVDIFRRQRREPAMEIEDHNRPQAGDSAEEALFDDRGEWVTPLQDWGNPEHAFEQKRFWEALELCLDRLPIQQARMFLLREVSGLSTEEICKELGVSSTNSWVMLYRARMSLRACLEMNWLDVEKPRRRT